MNLLRTLFVGIVAMSGICVAAAAPFWAQATFVKGPVSYLSPKVQQAAPLPLGTVLHRGDKVTAGEGARASFLLSDGGVLVVPAGTTVVLEPKTGAEGPDMKALAQNLSQSLLAREGDNPMLKHLGGLRGAESNCALAPCRTKVRPGSLLLLWTPARTVASYAVTVMGPGDQFFELTAKEPSVRLPAANLSAGGTYYWEIRDSSNKDTMSALGSGTFTVLDAKAEAELRTLDQQVAAAFPATDGSDLTPLFLKYQICRGRGLNLDALLFVDRMLQADPGNGELVGWRRDLCTEMGLQERDVTAVAAGLAPKAP